MVWAKRKKVINPFLTRRTQSKFFARGVVSELTSFELASSRITYLRSLCYGKLSKGEIEACRRLIKRRTRKSAKLVIRVAAVVPITRKPSQVRMGSGKGRIDTHVAIVSPGRTIFELRGCSFRLAYSVFSSVSKKLSLSTAIVSSSALSKFRRKVI